MTLISLWVCLSILFIVDGPSTTALGMAIAVFILEPGVFLPAAWWNWRVMRELDNIIRRVQAITPLDANFW